MKVLLRHILVNLLVIYLTDLLYPGFSILHDTRTLLSAAIIWLLLNKVVKPIIKLLLLPINLITLNLFSWAIGLITLFLLQLIVKGVSLTAYNFPGFSAQGFVFPAAYLTPFLSYVITSCLLNFLHGFVFWLIRKDSD